MRRKKAIALLAVLIALLASVYSSSVSLTVQGGLDLPVLGRSYSAAGENAYLIEDITKIGGGVRIGASYNFTNWIALGGTAGFTYNPVTNGTNRDMGTLMMTADVIVTPYTRDYDAVAFPIVLSLGGYLQPVDWKAWAGGAMAGLAIGPQFAITETIRLDVRIGADVLIQFKPSEQILQLVARPVIVGLTIDFPVRGGGIHL